MTEGYSAVEYADQRGVQARNKAALMPLSMRGRVDAVIRPCDGDGVSE